MRRAETTINDQFLKISIMRFSTFFLLVLMNLATPCSEVSSTPLLLLNQRINKQGSAFSCNASCVFFEFTGADQTYQIPINCTQMTAKAWGAGGGGYGSGWSSGIVGGGGGFAQASFSVTPGETLSIVVGGGGRPFSNYSAYGGGGKGYGTTISPGCDCGGSGGGRSEIRRGSTPLIVAGGGGGAGANTGGCDFGGGGGGLSGGKPGNNNSACSEVPGGQEVYSPVGLDGTANFSGGGGGGFKGGAGGGTAVSGSWGNGGAGGSGYVSGSGTLLIMGAGKSAANAFDPDRGSNGNGGSHGGNGGNGRVVFFCQ